MSKPRIPAKKQMAVRQVQHVWNYPVPPPDVFDKYAPDVKQQMLDLWRRETEHRHSHEVQILELQTEDMRKSHRYDALSLVLSFFLIGMLFAGSIYLAVIGQSIEAVGGLIGALVLFWRKRTDQKANS